MYTSSKLTGWVLCSVYLRSEHFYFDKKDFCHYDKVNENDYHNEGS